MSGVILRCSNCGTAQAAPGECEACHEAEVRYFCSNHDPGLWLDQAACPRCGARFGDPARAPRPPAPPVEARPEPRRAPTISRRAPPDSEPGPWDEVPREEPPSLGGYPRAAPDMRAILAELVAAAARSRRRSVERSEEEDYRSRPRRGGGCLRGLFLLAMIFVLLFLMVPFLLSAFLGMG